MKPTGSIHYARVENSARLQRVLEFLRARGSVGGTTRDIIVGANVAAVNSAISEIRCCGYNVRCDFERQTDGARVYRYTLIEDTQGVLF